MSRDRDQFQSQNVSEYVIRFTFFCGFGCHHQCTVVDRQQRQLLLRRVIMYQTKHKSLLSLPVCCRCFYLELNEQFDEMLTRHDDAVKEAINTLNAQTSPHPTDAD